MFRDAKGRRLSSQSDALLLLVLLLLLLLLFLLYLSLFLQIVEMVVFDTFTTWCAG
jgi:uncharacterized BrkB/YihY/UPF0761 family membrane protein